MIEIKIKEMKNFKMLINVVELVLIWLCFPNSISIVAVVKTR